MLVISEREAGRLVSLADALEVVEAAFVALDLGRAELFPVASAFGPTRLEQWAIKSGRLDDGAIGCKIGTYWPGNRASGLETHASTVFLLNPETGYPAAVVQASHLTALRTAAADAIAVKYLARPNASRLAVIGAGHQAWFDLQAIAHVRPLEDVRIWSRSTERAEQFVVRARASGLPARTLNLQEAIADADIIVTATAATSPLFPAEWVSCGAHISAMGADAPGKQELPIDIVTRARVFVDVASQSVSIGECQNARRAGVLSDAQLTALGAVIRGAAMGRQSADEITIFDSSGTAIQDLAVCTRAVANLRSFKDGGEIR